MPLQVEPIETSEAFDRLRPEWQALADAHGGGLPFRAWEWNRAWWDTFRADRFGVRDHLYVRALRTSDGTLVGVAPLMLTHRPRGGPLRLRTLEFFGADPNVTELRGVLCAPEREGEVYAALLDHLEGRADEWDYLRWRSVPAGGDAHRLLAGCAGVEVVQRTPNYVLDLPGAWDDLRAGLSRNTKEALRKCYNSLRREGHAFTLEIAASPAELPAALERFIQLHRARAEWADAPTHENVFGYARPRKFLLDVCARLAARDQLRVFSLRIGEQVVATRIGFVCGKTLYLYFSGYDPAWGPFSVMTTTVAEAMKHAIGMGLTAVNLSNGTDVSKTRWRPRQVDYLDLAQVSSTRRGNAAHLLHQHVERWMKGRAAGLARRLQR